MWSRFAAVHEIGEVLAVPAGMRELRIAVLSDLTPLIEPSDPFTELTFCELRLPIDPIQVELGIPLQWPKEE